MPRSSRGGWSSRLRGGARRAGGGVLARHRLGAGPADGARVAVLGDRDPARRHVESGSRASGGGAVLRRDAGLGRLRGRHPRGRDLVRRRHRVPARQLRGGPRRAADARVRAAPRRRRAARRCTGCDSAGTLVVTGGKASRAGADVALPDHRAHGRAARSRRRGVRAAAADVHPMGRQRCARRRRRRGHRADRSGCSTSPTSSRSTTSTAAPTPPSRSPGSRRGKQFDPAVVDAFCARRRRPARRTWTTSRTGPPSSTSEPRLQQRLTESELDAALEAIADFTDLRSRVAGRPFPSRRRPCRPRRGRTCGLPADDVVAAATRRAGARRRHARACRRRSSTSPGR